MFDLLGKRALVTGASSGLGRHFAKTLATAGADLVITARRTDLLEGLAAEIDAMGRRCTAVTLDMTDPTGIAALAPAIEDIDIVVNNAGITREAPFLDQSVKDWQTVIDTNATGMFLLTQLAGRAMRARGRGGAIINIASILGLRQAGGVASYAVSKAAAIQLTKIAALELARFGIRVNALAPGYIATDINGAFWDGEAGKAMLKRIPQRRLGRLEDLDGPLLLLASDASTYMTGAVIPVDGGHLTSGL
ncbi:SDR family NAD(P)-dependent oxidoreductase [Sphingomonas oryzagri]|uniref:SDR family oxidoreductase n=1 Tax=Sphingomonas oryzagri TaxID=3042314 RepID=A0ABT6MXG5_9SPHN|nr:SDR family oxidoreductase [Sphingomonas oryzagri]MDH7637740.1 SDR family oxidoreductase [Sphingomonas oryzagri]